MKERKHSPTSKTLGTANTLDQNIKDLVECKDLLDKYGIQQLRRIQKLLKVKEKESAEQED